MRRYLLYLFVLLITQCANQNLFSQTKSASELVKIQIDFSQTSSPVQSGFLGFLAEHENNSSFLPQVFTVAGTSVTVKVEWPEGTANTAKQMIDRGENTGAEYSDLLRDWIGTDGRVAKVPMKLTLSGLPAGLFEWLSYHHDNSDQTGVFSVKITDANGTKTVNGIDISNGNLKLENVTTFSTGLKSDGSDIVLQFEMDSYPDNSTSFFVMNGLVVTETDLTVLPGKVSLLSPVNQLKFVFVNPELKWAKSDDADNYSLFLGTGNPPEFFATVNGTAFLANTLNYNTTYFWKVEAENKNGKTESETWSFTTEDANSGDFAGEMEITFSHERNFYNEPFLLTLQSNHPQSNIIYTLDCSTPSANNGIIYSGGIPIDSTTVVKAVAMASGKTSGVYTNSFLFPKAILKQGKNPAGFPEFWGGSSTIAADYEMDPEIVNHPDYAEEMESAVQSLPTLSLTMKVDNWFEPATGIYVGYPNSDESREKAVTAEFMFGDAEESFAVECGVQNQGGTSIINWKVPKQSMRLVFKEMYGPSKLNYKLFPDSEIKSINTLVVDGLLYSWLHPWDDKQRITSLYFRDQLASDFQNKMGGLSFHGRYVHLYLNGLYWGLYDLHERPDDAFMAEYLDASREDSDIIKHNPNTIVQGSNESYLAMLDLARGGFKTNQDLVNIQRYLDLPAFIDYMVLNFYLGNFDWAHQNYYAARNKTQQTGFRFYTWDAEHVMRYSDVNYNNIKKNDKGGPTEIHTLLKENEEYRIMFADAVYKHFFNEGVFTPQSFEESFLYRKNEIEKAIILESARWGDYRESVSGVTYTRDGYWTPEVNKVLEEYIPNRRDIVISQLRADNFKLFPDVMPPVIQQKSESGVQNLVELVNPNSAVGEMYFTTDGSDPRSEGGIIHGTKYNGAIVLEKSSVVKARFLSKNPGDWSALAEKTILLDDLYGENIMISEIMYHPENNDPEFIEIINAGTSEVNVKDFAFTKGIDFMFSNDKIIPPGSGVVLTNDSELFYLKYGFSAFASYRKKLSNDGETLILKNGLKQVVDSVSYLDTVPWPVNVSGSGFSLEIIASDLDNALATSWKTSDDKFGTPINPQPNLQTEAGISPNPFKDNFTIKIDSPLTQGKFLVEIFNPFGSNVKSITTDSYNSGIPIRLGNAAPGIYLIRVSRVGDSAYEKIVLKAIKLNN